MKTENIFTLLAILSMIGIANAATITVDDSGGADYTKIQDAINAASAGDTIDVRSGIYYENVNVNKQLILRGMDTGGGKPVVDAELGLSAISLNDDGIVLDGFHIRNGNFGIYLQSYVRSYYNNTIINNFITNNRRGIGLIGANPTIYPRRNIISDNIITNNIGNGIEITASSENIITNNVIKENGYLDIYLSGMVQDGFCNNIIENNIGSGGRPIKYFNHSINLQNDAFSQLILCNADYSDINNITIAGSDIFTNNGLFIFFTDNSRFSNIYSSNNLFGLDILNSNNNVFERTVASNNFPEAGFRLTSSNNNVLINNTVNSNNWEGILLSNSNNNIIKYNTVSFNLAGSGMIPSGIYLDVANYNTITSNTASNNKIGIFVRGNGNIINDNIILNNYINGIYFLNDHFGNSVNNDIYNNIFNNTVNYDFSSGTSYNIWNTTKMPETNIMGGSYLGGNFWANPSDTGFSQTCTDIDKDGICDTSYILDSQNIDYLSLTTYTTCGNTASGQNINIDPSPNIDMTYESVIQCGDTSVTTYSTNQWSQLPNNYQGISFNDIQTTASYSNSIKVNIIYTDSDILNTDENSIKMFHYENGNWVDITTFLDMANNKITGTVNSLSPFAIAGISSGTPTPTVSPTVSPTTTISPTVTPISGNVVRGSSFDIIGIMILSLCLIIISLSRLRIKRK